MRGYYAGIGSRETPEEFRYLISKIVAWHEDNGFILRSGGADGADRMFELCVRKVDFKEIYLPWKGFNNNTSNLYNTKKEHYAFASCFQENWKELSEPAKKIKVRNCYQILGSELNSPVKHVICWTKDGKPVGGTGYAIRIANHFGIAVYNLANSEDVEFLKALVYK